MIFRFWSIFTPEISRFQKPSFIWHVTYQNQAFLPHITTSTLKKLQSAFFRCFSGFEVFSPLKIGIVPLTRLVVSKTLFLLVSLSIDIAAFFRFALVKVERIHDVFYSMDSDVYGKCVWHTTLQTKLQQSPDLAQGVFVHFSVNSSARKLKKSLLKLRPSEAWSYFCMIFFGFYY